MHPFVKEYFDNFYGARQADWYTWLLIKVVHFGLPGSLLDLGCGLGLFVELASRWGIEAVGLDGSDAAIAMALKRAPGLKVQHGDVTKPLPFPDRSFNNVTLHQVIAHLPSTALASLLLECHRVLKDQGVIFIFSPGKAHRPVIEKDPTICSPLYPSELRARLIAAGFKVVCEPNDTRFFPQNRLFSRPFRWLMQTRFQDWASATTNAFARRA